MRRIGAVADDEAVITGVGGARIEDRRAAIDRPVIRDDAVGKMAYRRASAISGSDAICRPDGIARDQAVGRVGTVDATAVAVFSVGGSEIVRNDVVDDAAICQIRTVGAAAVAAREVPGERAVARNDAVGAAARAVVGAVARRAAFEDETLDHAVLVLRPDGTDRINPAPVVICGVGVLDAADVGALAARLVHTAGLAAERERRVGELDARIAIVADGQGLVAIADESVLQPDGFARFHGIERRLRVGVTLARHAGHRPTARSGHETVRREGRRDNDRCKNRRKEMLHIVFRLQSLMSVAGSREDCGFPNRLRSFIAIIISRVEWVVNPCPVFHAKRLCRTRAPPFFLQLPNARE